MKYFVDIKGSCATREAFNYQEKINNEIKVGNYYFQKPIPVCISKVIDDDELLLKMKKELLNADYLDYVARDLDLSFNKRFNKKEYSKLIIVDFIDERMNVIRYKESYIEYRKEWEKFFDEYEFKLYRKFSDIHFFRMIDKYIENLLKEYGEGNVVINRAFAVYNTMFQNNKLPLSSIWGKYQEKEVQSHYTYNKINNLNRNLIKIYKHLNEKFSSRLKYIDLDFSLYYGDNKHRLKSGPYHYNKEFYYDFMEKVNNICENNYLYDEKIYINNVKLINKYFKIEKIISKINDQISNPELLLLCEKKFENNYCGNFSDKNGFYEKDNEFIFYYEGNAIFKINFNGEYYNFYLLDNKSNLYNAISIYKRNVINISSNLKCDYKNENNNCIVTVKNNKFLGKEVQLKFISRLNNKFDILFYYNNQLIYKINCFNNFIESISFYDGGILSKEVIYNNYIYLKQINIIKEYEDGKIKYLENYNLDGSIKITSEFLNDNIRVNKYYYDGNLAQEVQLNNKIKEVKKTYENGKLHKVTYFENGIPMKKEKYNYDDKTVEKFIRDDKNSLFKKTY